MNFPSHQAELLRELGAARDALVSLEWSAEIAISELTTCTGCPACGSLHFTRRGHNDNCILDAAIKRINKTLEPWEGA